MDNTLNQCISLEYVNVPVLDTSKWEVSHVDDYFMFATFYSCIKMKSIELLNTTLWNPTVDGTNLLYSTLGNFYGVEYVTLKGGLYSGIYGALAVNSMGIYDSQVREIRVDPDLIPVYQAS
jgi:hypothetical protein